MELDAEAARMIEAAKQRSMNLEWLTIEQVAALLCVSVRTIRRREASGIMPGRSRRGRRLCYRVEDIRNRLNQEI